MSGPKVVRVVTREEVIAICEGHIARLDKAIERWIREGMRRGLINAEEIAAVQRRRDHIQACVVSERFLELQKAAPEEIEFLKRDLASRQEKAALAAAQARQRARREVQAAASLLASLSRRGATIPDEVRAALEEAARGEGDPARAFAMGAALTSTTGPSNTQELAQRLKGDEPRRQIEDWIKAQPSEPEDARLAKIDQRIEELDLLLGREGVASFEERLTTLKQAAGDPRQNLLIDSLNIDLAQALTEARANAEMADKLEQALAALRVLDIAEAETLEARRASAPQSAHAALLQEVEHAGERVRNAHASAARRAAILKGLAELGYEIGETMDAAWVRDGRLVLKKPAHLDYGMELTGGVNADRLQMRAIAFNPTSDPARDRDAETLWCGDVSHLQQRLQSIGANLHIDKALAIGATPLKRVASADAEHASHAGDLPRSRTHDG